MGRQSQDVVVRFIGDTGNLGKGLDGLQGRFRAVTGSIEGIAKAGAAIGALSFFKTAIDEAREAARVTRQTEAVLKSTGGVANVTAGHIAQLSERMSELAGVDDEVIQHGANLLLTFTRVRNEVGHGNDVFDQATQLSLDMSAAMSQAGDAGAGLQETAIRIGKALNDPVKGMTALAKVGVTFTAQQKEQVKALVESGDILGAQRIILAELRTEFGGMAEATADSTAKAQVGFANLAEEVGNRLMPAVNAISSWAVNVGIPALTDIAGTTLDVVIPAVKFLVGVGKDVVGFFSDLPGPVQAAVVAFVAWKLAGDNVTGMFSRMSGPMKGFGADVRTVMSASQGEVGRFGASMQVLQDRVPTIGAMGAAFRTAKGDAEGFGSSLKGTMAAGFAGAKAAGTGLVSLLGGPWGIAITGATLGLTYFINKNQEAKKRLQEFRDAGKAVAQAITDQNGALNENTRLAAANAAEGKGLLKRAQDLGIATGDVVDAIEKQGASLETLREKLRGKVDADRQSMDSMELHTSAAFQLAAGIEQIVAGEDEHFAAQNRVRNATDSATVSIANLKLAQDQNLSSSDMLKNSVEALGGKFDDTKTDGQHLVDVIKGLTDAQTTAIDLEEDYEKALDSLTESIKDNGKTLDIHTDKGRNNRDALENAAGAIKAMTLADIESGVPAQEAIRRHDERTRALQQEANKAGFAKDKSQELINKYSEIPQNVRTIIQTQGFEETQEKLKTLSAGQYLLAKGMPMSPANLRSIVQERRFSEFATGGYVTGPGGPKSDVIPAWLSNREFVQPADTVAHYGVPFMEALRKKRLPRMAEGGMLNWPFPVDVTKTKIPQFGSAISVGRAGGNVARWAPLVLQALAMLGQPGALLPNVLRRMNQESGGNPSAINLWDVNAQRGTPSIGLMQTIGPTFNAYAGPFRSRGIYDPFANIYAGLNYAIHRYGNLQYAMDKPGGYRNGGWLMPGQLGYNETSKPEAVFTQDQLKALGTTVVKNYNLTVYNAANNLVDLGTQFRRMEMLSGD